ncbi:MAG: hypothetical protein R2854_26275 [Caldilineaceae bacterium]
MSIHNVCVSSQLTGMTVGGAARLHLCTGCAPGGRRRRRCSGAEVVTISFMGWGNPGEDEGVRNVSPSSKRRRASKSLGYTPENCAEKFLSNVAAGTPPDTAFIGSDLRHLRP